MKKEFFVSQIHRLQSVYSAQSLNEQRVILLWDRFKEIPEEQFEKAVTYLIGENTNQILPSVSRFGEAVAMFKVSHETKEMNITPIGFQCEPCRDFGFLIQGDLFVPCTCEAGKHMSPGELAKKQIAYDNYRGPLRNMPTFSRRLPYDPKKRGEAS